MGNPSEAPAAPLLAFRLKTIEAYVLRWPVKYPVRTSFGIMHDRPAVYVRVEDHAGHFGWGEIWCNFPACGAEHRARLLDTVLAPMVENVAFDSPQTAFQTMQDRTAVLAIQAGEPGPLAQVVSGIDLAIWDLVSRRSGQALWAFLGGTTDQIKVYASGINPDQPEHTALKKYQEGYRAFKLKVGFDAVKDEANVAAMRQALPESTELMVDANQAWGLEEACRMVTRLSPYSLKWIEEPLRADQPLIDWTSLARISKTPLAAGENLMGLAQFESMIRSQALQFIQPDLAKWGGISGCLPVIATTRQNGLTYCPHFLGGGIGLMASAHVMAATGGPGSMLEIDSNENPLRTEFSPPLQDIQDGMARLGHAPGIGVTPRMSDIERFGGK